MFENSLQNKIEIVNEVLILVTIYHLLMFTPIIYNRKVQNDFGMSYVAFIMSMIVFNFFFILKEFLY